MEYRETLGLCQQACVLAWHLTLLYIALFDAFFQRISRGSLGVLALSSFCLWLFQGAGSSCFLGAGLCSLLLLLADLLYPGSFGGGDIRLVFLTYLPLGLWGALRALMLALLLGGIAGTWGLLLSKRRIPFGPWLIASAAIVFGQGPFSDRFFYLPF